MQAVFNISVPTYKNGKVNKKELYKQLNNIADKMQNMPEESEEDQHFKATGVLMLKSPIINNNEFKNKRYYRYVDKIAQQLANHLITVSSFDIKITLYNIAIEIALDKLIAEIAPYNNEIKDLLVKGKSSEYDIYNIISNNDMIGYLCKSSTFIVQASKISYDFINGNAYPNDFLSIAQSNFETIVDKWLTYKYVEINDEEKFNLAYNSYIPTIQELHILFKEYLDLLYTNILTDIALYDRTTLEKNVEKKLHEYIETINSQHNTIHELQSKLIDEKSKAKDFLPTLVRLKKEAEVGTKEQQEIFDACIVEKNREIKRLEKQLNSLKTKLESLAVKEEDKRLIEEITIDKECDTTLKYTFVMVDYTDLENQLLSEFPNSIVVNSSDQFKSYDTDMVIFITQYLKHNMYYKIKNMCKTKNIPVMHFSGTNVDILKSEIAKNI